LAEEGWSSVHSVINEETFLGRYRSVKKRWRRGILVCPIKENGAL
jgi:ATP phosphoribosyltransferase